MSPNDAKHQSLRPCYRTRQTKTLSVCEKIGTPKTNQDFVCLQKNGASKVNQDLSVCFGEKESGGTSCPLPSGSPKVNQDFICLLLGERRYELLSMIEQSDIIRATSLPNASDIIHAISLPNAWTEGSDNHQSPITNYLSPITYHQSKKRPAYGWSLFTL